MFVAFGLLREQHVVRTSVVRVVAMGLRNHFNILGRRAFFPRVQCEQTAVGYELYKAWVLTITTLSITPCRSKEIKMAALLQTGFPSPMHKNHTKI